MHVKLVLYYAGQKETVISFSDDLEFARLVSFEGGRHRPVPAKFVEKANS